MRQEDSGFARLVNVLNEGLRMEKSFRACNLIKTKGLPYKSTVAKWLCEFVHAGYLRKVDWGVYRPVKEIPNSLTSNKLETLAYPNRTKNK